MPEPSLVALLCRRRWLAWLVLALLLAQTSALMHRVAHGAAGHARAHSVATSAQAGLDLAAVWSEHGKAADCLALDQLAQASPANWTSAVAATATHRTLPPAVWASAHPAALRPYQAQAPPVSA